MSVALCKCCVRPLIQRQNVTTIPLVPMSPRKPFVLHIPHPVWHTFTAIFSPAGLIDFHVLVMSDGTVRGNATVTNVQRELRPWTSAYRGVHVHQSYWPVSFSVIGDEVCSLSILAARLPNQEDP